MHWYEFKTFLEHASGFSMDALHVIVGVCLQLLAAAALRRGVGSPIPWLIVLAFELVNEWNDLHVEIWPDRPMQYGEGAKDVVLTMLLPTILLLVARRASGVLK